MPEPTLSLTTAVILQAIHSGRAYGFEIMDSTGLPSGTVYPALRRLERAEFIRTDGRASNNTETLGPQRKCYVLTREGVAALSAATERYPAVAHSKLMLTRGR
jgi:DNA-binding PadR family transcriptional regulator